MGTWINSRVGFGYLLVILAACSASSSGDPRAGDPDGATSGSPDAGSTSGTAFPAGTANGAPSSAVIGATGGALASADGKLKLTIPAGAFVSDTTIAIQPITNTAPGGQDTAYRLSPAGTTFAHPIEIAFTYTAADLVGSSPDALGVGFQDEKGFWWAVKGPMRDDDAGTITVAATHFSDWSRLLGWQIQPAQKTIMTGDRLALAVVYCAPQSVGDDLATLLSKCPTDEDLPSLPNFTIQAWAVDGQEGGNVGIGTVTSGNHLVATYTAPAVVFGQDVHAVSARLKLNGQTVLLVANIAVVGEGGFHVIGTFDVEGNATPGMDLCPQTLVVYFPHPRMSDKVEFLLVPMARGYQIAEIQNSDTSAMFNPTTLDDGSRARMDTNPEVLTMTDGTVISSPISATDALIEVDVIGSARTGGCTWFDKDGGIVGEPYPSIDFPVGPIGSFSFSTADLVGGSLTVPDDSGLGLWTWVITKTD